MYVKAYIFVGKIPQKRTFQEYLPHWKILKYQSLFQFSKYGMLLAAIFKGFLCPEKPLSGSH